MPAFLNPTTILGLLLALSLIGNGVLYKLHTHDLQQIGGLKQATRDAVAGAKACSDATKRLRETSAAREKAVAVALREAEAKAHAANARADALLQEHPASPDSCTAALNLNQRKLKERQP